VLTYRGLYAHLNGTGEFAEEEKQETIFVAGVIATIAGSGGSHFYRVLRRLGMGLLGL